MRLEDVSLEYVGWLNDPRTNQFLEVRRHRQTLQTVTDFVATSIESSEELLLKIVVSANPLDPSREQIHVGNLRIHGIDGYHKFAELGLVIGITEFRGKGIGQRALSLAEELSRVRLSLRTLTAGCYRANHASLRAFLSRDFSVVGARRNHLRLGSQFDDLVLLEKTLASRWASANADPPAHAWS